MQVVPYYHFNFELINIISSHKMQLPTGIEILETRLGQSKSVRYTTQERLGEGTFGEVRKAVDSVSGKTVAIKYVRILSRKAGIPKAVFREMESLKQLSHCEYIMRLFDVFTDESNLCLVMEYVESDLSEVILQSKQHLPRANLKCLFKMIFEGLSYCHSRNIIHRDIKPANLLLTSQGVVKLADFGLARIYDAQDQSSLSHQVATRQYRAPELLFASRHYTPSVDVWSAAVVMAELISLQALFPGNNDIDQMYRVFQVMGSPTPEVWPGVECLPDYSKVNFPNMTPLPLSLVLPQAHPAELHLLEHFLVLDPARRMSAQDALRLPYFNLDAPLPSPASAIVVPRRVKNTPGVGAKGKLVDSVEAFMKQVDAIVPK